MTKLNDAQENLLQVAKEAFEAILPVLDKMQADYEYAVYRAKKPLQDAVDNATTQGVPLSKLSKEAAGFTYSQKLTTWLEPAESVLDRLDEDVALAVTDSYKDTIDSIESVSRNAQTGAITATYHGEAYTISAMGPDEEPWAAEDEAVPFAVYQLIAEKFPGFVVLGEDD